MEVEKVGERSSEFLFFRALAMILKRVFMKRRFLNFLRPAIRYHVHSLFNFLQDVVGLIGDHFIDDPFVLGKLILKESNLIF